MTSSSSRSHAGRSAKSCSTSTLPVESRTWKDPSPSSLALHPVHAASEHEHEHGDEAAKRGHDVILLLVGLSVDSRGLDLPHGFPGRAFAQARTGRSGPPCAVAATWDAPRKRTHMPRSSRFGRRAAAKRRFSHRTLIEFELRSERTHLGDYSRREDLLLRSQLPGVEMQA